MNVRFPDTETYPAPPATISDRIGQISPRTRLIVGIAAIVLAIVAWKWWSAVPAEKPKPPPPVVVGTVTQKDVPVVELQVLSLAIPNERPDANFSAQLRFADGTLATLIYTTRGHRGLAKERIEVLLGNEAIVVDDFRKATIYRGSKLRLFPQRTKVTKGLQEEWDVFHEACVSGKLFPIALSTLRSVTETTFRIREAALR